MTPCIFVKRNYCNNLKSKKGWPGYPETSAHFYQTKRRHNAEDVIFNVIIANRWNVTDLSEIYRRRKPVKRVCQRELPTFSARMRSIKISVYVHNTCISRNILSGEIPNYGMTWKMLTWVKCETTGPSGMGQKAHQNCFEEKYQVFIPMKEPN